METTITNFKQTNATISPIKGDDNYAMIRVTREGKEYTKRLLVFTDEEMELTYDLIEKMEKEGKK